MSRYLLRQRDTGMDVQRGLGCRLEGKIASVRVQGQRDELEGRVAQVERQVARAVKQEVAS